MSWIDVTIWMIASACVTLALVHFRVWWSDRTEHANASFALVALGVALFGLCELGLIRAETTERFASVLRWTHVPIFMMVVGILSFVATYSGRAVPGLPTPPGRSTSSPWWSTSFASRMPTTR